MKTGADNAPVASIRIDLIDSQAMELWRTVAKIAAALGPDRRWCLVGGLMVALYAIEAQQSQRATTDIDVLADARARPSGTEWASRRLKALGATVREPGGSERERGFRFDLEGQVVDILAPDGLGRMGAATTGKLKTIQIPGGSQALARVEVVKLAVADEIAMLRRPKLIAAILLKARALSVHSRPQDQRHDLVTLLSMLDDPRAARDSITANELRWLRSIADRLAIDDPVFDAAFERTRLRAARVAYRFLVD